MLEWLKTILGEAYTEEVDKKVSEEIGKGFIARADFNTVNAEKKALAGQITTMTGQLDELKKIDPVDLQKTITDLQAANTKTQQEYDQKLNGVKRDFMLENRLVKEGVVNTKAVRALLDDTKISVDGENLVGIDDQITALKENEKWAFAPTKPVATGLQQGGSGTDTISFADSIKNSMFGQKT